MNLTPRTAHDDLHQAVAVYVCSILAVLLYAVAVPVRISIVHMTYDEITGAVPSIGDFVLAFAFILGGAAVGALAWLLLIERRPLRWFFRRGRPGRDWVLALTFFATSLLLRLTSDNISLVGGFYGTDNDNVDLFVWAPASIAILLTTFYAIAFGTYVVVRPIVDMWHDRAPAVVAVTPGE